MSHLFASAGSKLYIGLVKAYPDADFVASDFSGMSWTQIGGTTNLGSAGDTAELITSAHHGNARMRKLKGVRDAGSMEVVCDLDYADAGQIALIAAEKTSYTYAFRLVFNDAPPGGTPSERLFVALVLSAGEQYDEPNSVMKLNATLSIDSNIVRVPADAAGVAPDNTALPTITGTAEVGQTLTGTDGTWTGTPMPTLARQWLADGESLPGQTTSTLTLTGAHDGKVITFMVSASNHLGTAHAISAPTATVTDT